MLLPQFTSFQPILPPHLPGAFQKQIAEAAAAEAAAAAAAAAAKGLAATDASGNKKLGDAGLFVKKTIEEYFLRQKTTCTLKYIDPSYIVRR